MFDVANIATADCLVPMISRPGQTIDGKAVTLPPVRQGNICGNVFKRSRVTLFYRREIEATSLVNIEKALGAELGVGGARQERERDQATRHHLIAIPLSQCGSRNVNFVVSGTKHDPLRG
jgi:hypothetical protein